MLERMRLLRSIALLLSAAAAACGPADSTAIAVRVRMIEAGSGALRGFTPDNPPQWVRAEVVRASALDSAGADYKPAAAVESAWDALERDPLTERRFLLLDVKPNAGDADPYLLQVASLVEDEVGRPTVDACGVTGGIVTEKGEKKRVDLYAHLGDCGMLCADDARCVGPRWCLGFECQAEQACSDDGDCPAGAYCDGTSCSGLCGGERPDCRDPQGAGWTCCDGVCALGCAG